MQSGSKNKEALRKEMDELIAAFEREGGQVKRIERGVSGYEHNLPPSQESFHFIPSDHPNRTDLSPLIKVIDQRRHPQKIMPKKPKKILLKDDFGEPLRWVWSDQ